MGNQKKGVWWMPAVGIAGDVSAWIAVPIILALVAGKALDAHFGTKPWIFIALAGFAFLITIFGIVRVVKNYMKKLKK